MKQFRTLLLSSLLAVSACNEIPQDAYFNRGGAESLLDMSSEVVTVNLGAGDGLDELTGWINQEPPSRAELLCQDGDANCGRAREVLKQFNVQFEQRSDPSGTARLYYERVMARDCENRYINNSINPYNLNHPTFGCSLAANSVQMVSDKRQFVNPSLLDYQDGAKAVQAYRNYLEPNTKSDSGLSDEPLLSTIGNDR